MRVPRRLHAAPSPEADSLGADSPVAVTAAPAGATPRPGYDASTAETLRRVRPMLVAEPVAWLSTVRPDGLPHLVPTWFWWDGEALLVFSKPDAVKVRNLRANPRLMVALGRPEEDFSVGLIEAEAVLVPGPADIPEAFLHKYAAELAAGVLDRAAFRATFTQAVRIVPTRFLAWHGRGASQAASGSTRSLRSLATDVAPVAARDRAAQRRRFPRSSSTSRAALRPGAPVTPPPGWAPEPARYSPSTGIR